MLQISGRTQHYAWGSPTAIPGILGIPPNGQPHAEYWLGAHEAAPSTVAGTTLDVLLAGLPTLLGPKTRLRFGGRLPFLMKILAADQPLSLQAHPNQGQAEEGFAREEAAGVPLAAFERVYRDARPKPESIIALTEFHGLCGFRDPRESADLFDGLGVLDSLESILGPLVHRRGAAALAEVFLDVLSLTEDRRDSVYEVLAAASDHAHDDGALGDFARTALELDEHFPGETSILGALLLNRFALAPGEGIFLPAGNMHSYMRGVGVEVMANSDNVLRGGLTAKHIDVAELVRVVDFAPEELHLMEVIEAPAGVFRYVTDAAEFAVWRLEASPDGTSVPATDELRIVLVTDGAGQLVSDGVILELAQGAATLLAAGEEVLLSGAATAFVAAPGIAAR